MGKIGLIVSIRTFVWEVVIRYGFATLTSVFSLVLEPTKVHLEPGQCVHS